MAPIRIKASQLRALDAAQEKQQASSPHVSPVASSSKLPDAETSSAPPTQGSSGLKIKIKPYSRAPRPEPLSLGDLECVRTLGEGGFGIVCLVRPRPDAKSSVHPRSRPDAQFAMKVIRKKAQRQYERGHKGRGPTLLREGRAPERRFLTELPWNPFFTGLVDVFVDKQNFYLLLELSPCTSLWTHMRKRGPISCDAARFYFANITLGLEFLHSHDIVHRDLKPQNVLMNADGYLCIADLGCAAHKTSKYDWDKFGTFCYGAPEVSRTTQTHEDAFHFIDWWAAAVTLFEMVTGKLPFKGKTHDEVFDQAMEHNLKWPTKREVDPDLKDLVEKMLIPEPSERYGCMVYKDEDEDVGRNDEVRIHPWVHKKVQWKAIAERRAEAPYVPVPHPDLAESWHNRGVPTQAKMPELKVVSEPPEKAWDSRFMHRKHER